MLVISKEEKCFETFGGHNFGVPTVYVKDGKRYQVLICGRCGYTSKGWNWLTGTKEEVRISEEAKNE